MASGDSPSNAAMGGLGGGWGLGGGGCNGQEVFYLVVVDQFTPVYPFTPIPKFLQNNHSYTINYECI